MFDLFLIVLDFGRSATFRCLFFFGIKSHVENCSCSLPENSCSWEATGKDPGQPRGKAQVTGADCFALGRAMGISFEELWLWLSI